MLFLILSNTTATKSTGLPNKNLSYVAANDSNIFVGSQLGVFRSTNSGISWSAANNGLTNFNITTLSAIGSNIFAGTNWSYSGTDGIYISTNNGANWTPINTGISSATVYAIVLLGDNLFIGSSWGVWRRPLTDIVTDIQNKNDLKQKFVFALHQNFPNPFNPTTSISFTIPSKSFVSLKIYDLIGKEVATLVSEVLPEGNYSKQWIAFNIPSAIYFYRLQVGEYTETKKLILLK